VTPSRILSLRSRVRRVRDTRQPVQVLHVGKTGGTALKHVLIEHQGVARYRLLFLGHEIGLAEVPVGERFMFLIRDPLSRFVSAFNGRLREDRPRYHYLCRKRSGSRLRSSRRPISWQRHPMVAHQTPPGFEEHLGEAARSNLEGWYERDIAFVQLCRELAPLVNGAA